MKTIKVSAVVFEMLQELAKRKRVKTDFAIESMVKEEYNQK